VVSAAGATNSPISHSAPLAAVRSPRATTPPAWQSSDLAYHALLAGLQVLVAEDYAGALTIAAAPAFIAFLRPGDHPEDPDLQRLCEHAVQMLSHVRGKLTLHEQWVVPPHFVEATELAPPAAKPLQPRVIGFVTQLNANSGAVTDEDLDRLQIRGTDTYLRIRLPELLPLSR